MRCCATVLLQLLLLHLLLLQCRGATTSEAATTEAGTTTETTDETTDGTTTETTDGTTTETTDGTTTETAAETTSGAANRTTSEAAAETTSEAAAETTSGTAAETTSAQTNTTTERDYCIDYGYLCGSQGTCVKEGSGYRCACAAGYIGLQCNVATSDLSVFCRDYNLCRNGATCMAVGEESFRCECTPGFSGTYCQTNIDDCSPNPCTHGVCIDRVANFSCVCASGWEGRRCNSDINECASNPCDANADCTNTPGAYRCACRPGYYGNGTVCYELTVLPVTNATRLGPADFNKYSVSNVQIQTELPFIIGQEESSTCRISKDGFLTFSNPPYQLNWPTYYTYLTKPVVFPYWSYNYNFSTSDSAVHYELLDNENHANHANLRKVSEIVTGCNETGDTFQPLSALIVTWTKMEPYSWYVRYGCYYCNYYYRQLGYQWAAYYCKYCTAEREHITFQAIVTRNATHSFAVFNYGDFRMSRWRWYYYYVAAGFSDGHSRMQSLPFAYYWWRYDNFFSDNLRLGNCGKRGRHLLVLANELPPSKKLQCRNWLLEDRKHKVLDSELSCNTCPRDLRQAILDWRYWPYEYSCDKRGISTKGSYKLTMCFRGRHQCVQDFKNFTCRWSWSWWCSWQRCQFFHAPRCCYSMNINWKRDGVLFDYCDAGYSTWELRWRLRREMFDRNRSGQLIRNTNRGAGHSMLIERKSSSYWWFYNYDEQLRNETHGYDVCRAGKMFARFRGRRPKCNSNNYTEPVWGFNRGDPHISTLDGLTYSFNGLCEYYMLRNISSEFQMLELQARTSQAQSARPSVPSRATVFTAFAVKAGTNNVSIAALLNSVSDDIDVYSDSTLLGSVRAFFFGRENATEVENYSLQSSDNNSITISESDTGFSLTVTKTLNFLQAAVQLDQEKHRDGVEGLMGNFNNNATDDYRMRNGTQLAAGSSERQLFDFGQSWRLQSGDVSHFPYLAGTTQSDFCNLSFVPIFVEDYRDNLLDLFSGNASLMASANETCRNPTETIYLSCMYDAAQLQTVAAAEEAVLQVQQQVSAKAVAKNTPPQWSMPPNITVTAGTAFTISLSFSDAEANAVTLSIEEPIDNSSLVITGNSLTWQVGHFNTSVNLIIVATDSIGAPAAWQPVVLYCHCVNGGQCDFAFTTSDSATGETFYRAQCICPDGYQGDSCETQPCNARPSPCYNETMCNMLTNGSYSCGPCPAGLKGDGRMCEDTNECLESPGICQETCTNLAPGYECTCTTPGYKVSPSNNSLCVDIDECSDGSHSCRADQNQTCVNTPGSYRCDCARTGFRANALYECQDIDECRETSGVCGSEVCINTEGSYFCECAFGQVRQQGACKTLVVNSGSSAPNTNDNVIVIVCSVIGGTVLLAAVIGVVAAIVRMRPRVEGL